MCPLPEEYQSNRHQIVYATLEWRRTTWILYRWLYSWKTILRVAQYVSTNVEVIANQQWFFWIKPGCPVASCNARSFGISTCSLFFKPMKIGWNRQRDWGGLEHVCHLLASFLDDVFKVRPASQRPQLSPLYSQKWTVWAIEYDEPSNTLPILWIFFDETPNPIDSVIFEGTL